jgi:hypothetical protein
MAGTPVLLYNSPSSLEGRSRLKTQLIKYIMGIAKKEESIDKYLRDRSRRIFGHFAGL